MKNALWSWNMGRFYILIVSLIAIATPALAKDKIILPAPQLPSDYQQMASTLVLTTLREPETAKVEFRSAPYQMVCGKGVLQNKERIAIWMVDLWVNARNGYGGFTGFQGVSVIFFEQDGNLMQQSYTKLGGGAITRFGLCKKSEKS